MAPIMCATCGKRPGTETWVGEGGALAFNHGFYQMRCKVCCVTDQLDYARKCAADIPELERELAALTALEAR